MRRDPKSRFPAPAPTGERERLDEFLTCPDPVLVASLQAEEKDKRRRGRWVSTGVLLLLLAGVTALALLLPDFCTPLNVGRNPGDLERARTLAAEGRQYMQQSQAKEARAKFQMAVVFAPSLPDGWTGFAAYHRYHYQQAKAEELLRKALALDPGYEPALLILGDIAFAEGRQGEAEALWKRCSDQRSLGQLYLYQGRFREAARILERESRKYPGDPALRRMVDAARANRITPEVDVLIRPTYPLSHSPFVAQGWALMRKGRPGDAVPVFRKAVAAAPRSVVALNGLGWALFDSGRRKECRPFFERSLSVRPDDLIALNGRANCLRAEGRVDEAIADWKRVESIYGGPSSATKHLASVYYERGDCEQAAGYLARRIKKYPEDKPAIEALEDCLQKLGRRPAPQASP